MNLVYVIVGAVVAIAISGFLLWAMCKCGKNCDEIAEKGPWMRRHAERMNKP